MPGLGAFVTETDYKCHIANYVDQPEVGLLLLVVSTAHIYLTG